MYLRNFNNKDLVTEFDPADGTGGEFFYDETADTAGYCEETGYGWVAIYPDPETDTLIVQVDGHSWDLYGPTTEVRFGHDVEEGVTAFEIGDDDKTFEARYEAWWTDARWFEPDPDAGWDRENAEEDLFGFIFMLAQFEDDNDDYLEPWKANLPDG